MSVELDSYETGGDMQANFSLHPSKILGVRTMLLVVAVCSQEAVADPVSAPTKKSVQSQSKSRPKILEIAVREPEASVKAATWFSTCKNEAPPEEEEVKAIGYGLYECSPEKSVATSITITLYKSRVASIMAYFDAPGRHPSQKQPNVDVVDVLVAKFGKQTRIVNRPPPDRLVRAQAMCSSWAPCKCTHGRPTATR